MPAEATHTPLVDTPAEAPTHPTKSHDIAVIFAGSWLFCFEQDPATGHDRIRAVSPMHMDHDYLYGKCTPTVLGTTPLAAGHPYTITVEGRTAHPPTPAALMQPMIAAGIGFVHAYGSKPNANGMHASVRTVLLPLPDRLDPVGLDETTRTFFAHMDVAAGTKTGPKGLMALPAAYVFHYDAATRLTVAGPAPHPALSVSPGDHVQFRVLQSKMTGLSCVHFTQQEMDQTVMHEMMVFPLMMNMIDTASGAKPSILPDGKMHPNPCSVQSGVDAREFGWLPECTPSTTPVSPEPPQHTTSRFTSLGACGQGGGFVGGDSGGR